MQGAELRDHCPGTWHGAAWHAAWYAYARCAADVRMRANKRASVQACSWLRRAARRDLASWPQCAQCLVGAEELRFLALQASSSSLSCAPARGCPKRYLVSVSGPAGSSRSPARRSPLRAARCSKETMQHACGGGRVAEWSGRGWTPHRRPSAWRSGRGRAGSPGADKVSVSTPSRRRQGRCRDACLRRGCVASQPVRMYACASELAHRRRRAEWRNGAGASQEISGRCRCSARHSPLLTKLAADVGGTDERQSAQ